MTSISLTDTRVSTIIPNRDLPGNMAAQAPDALQRDPAKSNVAGAPDDSQLLAGNLFRVDGLVAVITGGGSG